jgi:hypothetical protein
MKGKQLTIRPAISLDYDAIGNLLNKNFQPVAIEKRKKLWEWRHNQNPAVEKDMPAFLVAEKSEQLVGVHGLIPMRFKVGYKIITGVCSCDYAVDPRIRSAGMKLKLQAFSKEISQLHISTSANEAAYKVTLALGGKELKKSRIKFLKVLKYQDLISSRLKNKTNGFISKILGSIAGVPLNLFSAIKGNSVKVKTGSEYELRQITAFDTRHDDFWNEIASGYGICTIRDSRYLNWRYKSYPFGRIESLELMHKGNIKGILAIHHSIDEDNLPFSAILETLVDRIDNKSLEILLAEAIQRAIRTGSHYITVAPHDAEDLELYRRHGFRIRTAHFSPFTYKNNSDIDESYFDDESKWYFSLGDGDICYYMN